MNKNPLEQKLINNSKERVESNHSDISKVRLLLAADAAEEINILKSIGLDHHIKVAENKQGDNIIRTTGEERFGKPIVALAEIERLCKDYRLYMRKANEYIGSIPNDLGVELKHFCKKCEIDTSVKNSDYSDFYIIAPPKMFKGYTSPLNNFLGTLDEMQEEREARIRARELDPILVYKDPNNAGYYAIVKSWGKDFTPMRRLYAMLTTKTFINLTISFAVRLLFPFLIYLFYAYMNNGTTLVVEHKGHMDVSSLNVFIQIIVGAIILITLIGSTFEDGIISPFRKHLIKSVCKNPINENHYRGNRR
jgi:hypothetical protein